MYPALRSDRFDPLEKACDSTMLASLPRGARAASLWFYAGFLNRPTTVQRVEPTGRWRPPRHADARTPAPGRSTRACVSTVRLTGRHRDGRQPRSVGTPSRARRRGTTRDVRAAVSVHSSHVSRRRPVPGQEVVEAVGGMAIGHALEDVLEVGVGLDGR